MAKGQKRSSREPRKPKKVKPAVPPLATSQKGVEIAPGRRKLKH
jgi:hypothetical protein